MSTDNNETVTNEAVNNEPANKENEVVQTKIVCLPGQRLCIADENTVSGHGTYERDGYIYASLLGTVNVNQQQKLKVIEVNGMGKKISLPMTGDIVTARVLQVNQRMAKCDIIGVRDETLDRTFRAILRKEDVRATEKDRVKMYESFKTGDIILARVLPQTELSSFHLTTAENELGVVVAVADDEEAKGVPMVPISWTQMQCPNTLIKEPRKVAKVVPESKLKNAETTE